MCEVWVNLLSVGNCQVIEWLGDGVGEGTKSVAGNMLDGAAQSAGQSAGQLITASLTWWTFNGSVDFGSPTIRMMQSYTMPLTVIMLTAGVLLAAVRTAIARKGEPLLNLATNLVGFVVVSVAGVGMFAALQAGGDAFSEWIMKAAGADFGQRFVNAATVAYSGAFGIILISLLCILVAFIQWILMLFRMAALVILAGMLPMAGAASVMQGRTDSTKRVITWSVAILIYKPVAAIIYAEGFVTLSDAEDLRTMLQGVVILIMAVIALPSLVKLFSWAGTATSSSGGGIAAAAGLAGLAMARRGRGKGGGGDGGAGPEQEGSPGSGETGDSEQQGSPGDQGGPAGQHAQEMESNGPGAMGGEGGDTPADSGATEAADEATAATSDATSEIGGDIEAGGSDSSAAAAAASGGAAAGADAPVGGGGAAEAHPAAAAAQATSEAAKDTYEAAQNATESATDPGPLAPDEPS